MGKHRVPRTLIEAVAYFADQQIAHDFFVTLRWPNGVGCPHCGNAAVHYMPKYRRWTCKECRQQFTAKTGTIFEDSPITFSKWLPAIWLLTATRNGTSSCELARALGVTQKTAWFMLHRIREALTDESTEPFSGPVEADETYVGGKYRADRDHHGRAKRKSPQFNKTTVMGIVERKGSIRAFVVPSNKGMTLADRLRMHVAPGATVYTDAAAAYGRLSDDYVHHAINHALEYVRDHVHTNNIEGFWSVFKRTIRGTYIAPRPKHLQRYVEEQVFRFNQRENEDGPRFIQAAKMAEGKRLKYKDLTAKG